MSFDFVLRSMLKFFRRKEREKTFQAEGMGKGSEVCESTDLQEAACWHDELLFLHA